MTNWWLGEETLGELIARAREQLGKSQYALAAALREAAGRGDGIPDRSMVARWETGRRIPTPYWRTYLAAVLAVSPADIDKSAAVARAQRAHRAGSSAPAEEPQSAERLRYVLAHPDRANLVSVAHLREQVRRLDEQFDRAPLPG